VVLDETGILNAGGLRYENEPAKHKVLDAIGDLYLMGHLIIGQYTAYKSGHALNNALARALLSNREAFEMVSFPAEDNVPQAYRLWRLKHASV
jgi:UDP-3-O-[3-hydroxymyristoyl] N-acetylglucosamine deacetylase